MMAKIENESEFTTNPVLAVLDMAAKKGLKFDFDGDGTYESLEDIVSGKDGNAFASWALNQETPNGVSMKTLPSFISSGAKTSFAKCKPGDLLVKHTGEDKHIYIVIKNDVTGQRFILADGVGNGDEVRLCEQSYSKLSGTYVARDMSQVYGR